MGQVYQHLLSITFKHNYFSDGQFKPLQISFDQETTRLLKNLGVILKPFPGGAHFLVSDPELLKDENQNAPIRLFLDCSDPYYINYSELDGFRPSDTMLYFNNVDPIPNSRGTGLQLHSEEYVGQNDRIPLSFETLTIANFEPHTDYYFEDLFGNDISDHINQSPSGSNQFLVSGLEQGIIKIFAGGQEEAQVYYQPKRIGKKTMGIVELYVPQLFERYSNHGKEDYTLNFNSRRTIWKYFLLDPTYKKFKNLSIIDRAKEQVFNLPQKQKIQEAEALVFESKNKIALSEFSEDSFQLVDQFDTTIRSGKVVLKILPRASHEQLYREDASSTESLYSHIYI